MKTKEYIKSDFYRYLGKSSFFKRVFFYLRNSTIRWQVAFRLCHSKGILKFFGNCLWYINRSRKRIQIEKNTTIGYGLYLAHNGFIVINSSATIGDNCNFSQFTTIGANGSEKAATIGNEVYLGPSCCVVGSVQIGNCVTVGAGSIVTKDLPDNSTAVGNYAKVINYNNPARFIKNKYLVK